MAPTEQIVELQGGRTKTRVLSAGEGDPVVFTHGAGGLLWDPFLDRLAQRYRVIAPEHLGSGQSQGLENVEDLWDLVLYYADLFDALGLPTRLSLIGHSFGGMVAAEIAATHAERVSRLVLLCPIGLWRDEHPVPEISAITPDKLPGLLFADPTGPVAQAMPRPDPTDPEALFQASLTIAAVNQFIWPLPDKGLSKRLHRIKADTLVVWGRQDKLVAPVYGEDFARAIPGARLELVEGAGHLPQLEQFDKVAGLVEGFLTG
ncbi:MAG: alpha/beta fold hydrolase [Acidimicrobiia bacterium]|nr:alpha/beta fold hydrolase [Acidimicrobiia bacterium]